MVIYHGRKQKITKKKQNPREYCLHLTLQRTKPLPDLQLTQPSNTLSPPEKTGAFLWLGIIEP